MKEQELVNDSIVTKGHIVKGECHDCGKKVTAVTFGGPVKLPNNIPIHSTIFYGKGNLGISCGCYARAHRQIAHIGDNLKRKK